MLLENKEFNLPLPKSIFKNGPVLPYVLVGDEAFPLTNYMMRPYPGKNRMTLEKRIYNYRLSRARRTVENVFGILANQWRLLRRSILAKISTATKTVQAIVCLHNWLRKHDFDRATYVTEELADRPVGDGDIECGSWRENIENDLLILDVLKQMHIRYMQLTYEMNSADILMKKEKLAGKIFKFTSEWNGNL